VVGRARAGRAEALCGGKGAGRARTALCFGVGSILAGLANCCVERAAHWL